MRIGELGWNVAQAPNLREQKHCFFAKCKKGNHRTCRKSSSEESVSPCKYDVLLRRDRVGKSQELKKSIIINEIKQIAARVPRTAFN